MTLDGRRVISTLPQVIIYKGTGTQTRKWGSETSVIAGRSTTLKPDTNTVAALPSPTSSGNRPKFAMQNVWAGVSFEIKKPDKPKFAYGPTEIPGGWDDDKNFAGAKEDTVLATYPYLTTDGHVEIKTSPSYANPDSADEVIVSCGETLPNDKTATINVPLPPSIVAG